MTVSQRIFAVGRPTPRVVWDDLARHMQAEAAHAWSLYEQGVLRDAWVRTDALGAVYAFESRPAEVARVLADFPTATRRLVEFELIPVGPYTPLAWLFGTQAHPVPAAPRSSGQPADHVRVLALGRLGPAARAGDPRFRLADDARDIWRLWKGGVIRDGYLRTDRPGTVLLLEAPGVMAAQETLADLPLVRAGLVDFECLALATFMGYDALLDGSLDEPARPLRDPTRTRDRSPSP